MYVHKIHTTFVNKAHGPTIITHPVDTTAGAPFSGVFTCSASGYGKLSIEWRRTNGLNVPVKSYHTEETSQHITTSTFIIPNVNYDDTGGYYCIGLIGMQASLSKTALLYFCELKSK